MSKGEQGGLIFFEECVPFSKEQYEWALARAKKRQQEQEEKMARWAIFVDDERVAGAGTGKAWSLQRHWPRPWVLMVGPDKDNLLYVGKVDVVREEGAEDEHHVYLRLLEEIE